MSTCVNPSVTISSPLSSKVALFNAVAQKHIQGQAINPFSNDNKVGSLPRQKFSKEEYGRPVRGSLSEARGAKANLQVCKEMYELCEVISTHGEPLYTPEEKANDPRIVISFGELFDMYTVINDKLVGLLIRARKHKLLDFEGEVLFQRRDDHIPVILLRPIEDIKKMLFPPKVEEPPEPIKSVSEDEELKSSSDEEVKSLSDEEVKSEEAKSLSDEEVKSEEVKSLSDEKVKPIPEEEESQ